MKICVVQSNYVLFDQNIHLLIREKDKKTKVDIKECFIKKHKKDKNEKTKKYSDQNKNFIYCVVRAMFLT